MIESASAMDETESFFWKLGRCAAVSSCASSNNMAVAVQHQKTLIPITRNKNRTTWNPIKNCGCTTRRKEKWNMNDRDKRELQITASVHYSVSSTCIFLTLVGLQWNQHCILNFGSAFFAEVLTIRISTQRRHTCSFWPSDVKFFCI